MCPLKTRKDAKRRKTLAFSRLFACSAGGYSRFRGSFRTPDETYRDPLASRDAMARASACDVILSLDDDSYPLEQDAIARVRELFEKNARLAVASFPQRTDEFPETLDARDFGAAHFVGTYMSC